MKKMLRFNLIIIVGLVFTYGCKKGDTGPAGVAGPAGPTGAAGQNGIQGPTGSANVIYSDWATSPTASRDTTVDGTCMRVRTLAAPAIDTAILNRGLMITYMRVGSIGPYQLPYISDAGGAVNQINCIYKLKKIFVYRSTYGSCRFTSTTPGTEPVLINLPQSIEYRYVLIPGGILGGRMVYEQNISIQNLKAMSYETLIKTLGIPENGSNFN